MAKLRLSTFLCLEDIYIVYDEIHILVVASVSLCKQIQTFRVKLS
jgi:hypothetical protein